MRLKLWMTFYDNPSELNIKKRFETNHLNHLNQLN